MSELPKGWVACTPSDLANDPKNEIVDGPFGSNLKASEYTDEGTPIVRIQNVKRMAFLDKNIKYVTDEKAEFLKRHSFKSGDLLITKLGEPLGLTCIAPEHLNEGIIVADIVRFRPNPEVNRKCLAYLLNSEKAIKQINEHTKGSTRSRINLSVVRNLDISLPPLAEQKRIVEKLDEVLAQVDTIKARLDSIPNLLKRFRQSVLASAVSGKLTEEWRSNNRTCDIESLIADIGLERESLKSAKVLKRSFGKHAPVVALSQELPDSWVWTCFDSISENDNNALKAGPFGSALKKSDYVSEGYRVYGQEQVIAGDESLVSYYISEDKYEQLKACSVKAGDILISLVGTIGKVLILSNDVERGVINPRLVKLSLNYSIQRRYIKAYLDSPIAWDFFKGFSHGGTMDILNLGILKKLPIALPPIEEQKEIVRLVDQYFAFADTVETQVKKAQARVDYLTQSILAKAFRGELVSQDPSDEPADKLLERIAKAREEAEALAKAAKKAEAAKKRAAKA
ncbi:restriction endonuclease subunit S [Vibrio sp.]|uniref:restriction endonuclease subunit S n=1 Tax=Vibrio sp. TaxID=678 RepID=UPI003F6A8CE3